MSPDPVKILIVSDDDAERERLIDQLRYVDTQVVGESTFGSAAHTWATQLGIDVVVLFIKEPVARSLRTIELLTTGEQAWPIVAVSASNDREMMRKAMVAGARDFLVLPASGDQLRAAILNVHRIAASRSAGRDEGAMPSIAGEIITVFGVKGGIGKSVTAANLAVALAQGNQHQVVLVDADLQFGDAAVMLDINPERTIAQAAAELDPEMPSSIEAYVSNHASHLRLLAAPLNPGDADGITPDQIGEVFRALAATHDFVVVDTGPHLDEYTALAIDLSAIVIVLVSPEVPCMRRTRAALTILQEAGYTKDKIKLVLNRLEKGGDITVQDVESVLDYPIYHVIPDDPAIGRSVSLGVPVVMSGVRSTAGQAYIELGDKVAGISSGKRAGARRWPFRRPTTETADVPAPQVAHDQLMAVWTSAIEQRAQRDPANPEQIAESVSSAWKTGKP